jgi:sterol desaturase/sphingolipid hydroxylase (fatty acid hydroxylase superfamily)
MIPVGLVSMKQQRMRTPTILYNNDRRAQQSKMKSLSKMRNQTILSVALVASLMTSNSDAFAPSSHRQFPTSFQQRRLSTRAIDEMPIVIDSSASSSTNNNEVFAPSTKTAMEENIDVQMTTTLLQKSPSVDYLSSEEVQRFTPFRTLVRTSVVATFVGYLINPQPLDCMTASVWSAIYNWSPAQLPLFEAEVATAGFFGFITFFSLLHLVLGEEQTKASRIDGKLPVDPLSWAKPQNFHLWFNPTASYLGSIWLYLQVHHKPAFTEVAPTFGVFMGELLFGVFMYDLCFFPIHYIMHHSPWGNMRKVHGYHHRWSNHGLNSLETVQHSYLDGFLQVFVNIMVQQISPFGGPKHPLSKLFHNIVVTYLLSEAHSGYNLPWMSHNLFPEILGGSPRHEKHHHDGRVYYQQYFKYLDDFFGFTDEGIAQKKQEKNRSATKKEETSPLLSETGDPLKEVSLQK